MKANRGREDLGFVQEAYRRGLDMLRDSGSSQCRHVAEERLGVDVCLTEENLESAPECPHGKKC